MDKNPVNLSTIGKCFKIVLIDSILFIATYYRSSYDPLHSAPQLFDEERCTTQLSAKLVAAHQKNYFHWGVRVIKATMFRDAT